MKKEIKKSILKSLAGAGHEGLNISETSHRAEITRNTASVYLKKLEEKGFVDYSPKPPHRFYSLTKKGERTRREFRRGA